MIKRRFYKRRHGNDDSSSSSSSDSDSDSIPEVEEEDDDDDEQREEVEEDVNDDHQQQQNEDYNDDEVEIERAKSSEKKKKRKKKKTERKRDERSPSPGSGYQSEDSSVNEVNLDSSGLPASEEEDSIEKDVQIIDRTNAEETVRSEVGDSKLSSSDPIQSDLPDCVLKCKSVFKCKLCPRIVCLSEETVRAHLISKRHARSEKLLDEGRLKLMLNSDGEIEEDQETHAERHTRTVTLAQELAAPAKKDKGRQRQNRRRKKRMRIGSNKGKSELTKDPRKKQRKNEV